MLNIKRVPRRDNYIELVPFIRN
ncbi:hypothetical protein LCGC14_2693390, partial [marine sediment metagenome]